MPLTKDDWVTVRSSPLFADVGADDLRGLAEEHSAIGLAHR